MGEESENDFQIPPGNSYIRFQIPWGGEFGMGESENVTPVLC